jgi:hypothetical protein
VVVQSQGLVLTDEFRHALELPAADIVQRRRRAALPGL